MENNASGRVPEFAHPSIIVDFNNASHIRLLERAWDELYQVEFPHQKQQETVADWKRRNADPRVGLSVPIIGENLDDPVNAIIKGFAVGTLFKKSGTLLQDYTVAGRGFRKQGIGEQLMLERKFNAVAQNGGMPLNGRFAEIDDPNKLEGEGRKKAEKRSKGFLANGQSIIVPVDYTQPSLSGFDKDDDLVLISYRLDNGQYASPEVIEGMMVEMYQHYGIYPPQDVDLVRMRKELRQAYPELRAA